MQHLKSSADLRTSYGAIRAGFVSLALEKNRRATPFVEEARSLKVAATAAKKPSDLKKMSEIRKGLLTAAGVSDKAANHLEESDKDDAIFGLIANFLEPAGDNFVEELVFRFLLTRGDTLGGSMRNAGGFMAEKKLTRSIISCLRIAGKPVPYGCTRRPETGIRHPKKTLTLKCMLKAYLGLAATVLERSSIT